MKVESVEPFTGEYINFEGKYQRFIRYGEDCWQQEYGESWETVYNCTELEAAYQAWKAQQ